MKIKSREQIPWPQTSQDILQVDKRLEMNKKLFYHIALVVSPNSALGVMGSQMVVNDLKQLGHGISNTEAIFIHDKWE